MKAVDKAKKLVDKFQVELMDSVLMEETQEEIAKQCALKCVNEILEEQFGMVSSGFLKYWIEVTEEIKKL